MKNDTLTAEKTQSAAVESPPKPESKQPDIDRFTLQKLLNSSAPVVEVEL